ncbi:MAG: carbon-nitrogen hydrolase family protein [Alphaproteobacteria bacterium]|nr:MAG: carbon-nitrogen hydrolase family protein [Alphaproteobacteria bacterium]
MTKVAIAQAGTYLLDNARTLEQMRELARDAATQQCDVILFPEAYVGGYPKYMDFGTIIGTRSTKGRELFAEYASSAMTIAQADIQIAECAQQAGITIITGFIERDDLTLYCSVVAYNTEGERIGHRRKLMPTAQERVIWGQGESVGSPFDTVAGRVGALICWESYMPLARMSMYQQGIELYAAPTVDDRDGWQHTMRHIAREGCCFVLSACQYMTRDHVPEHWKEYVHDSQSDVLIRGGSCIVHPMGHYITEPIYGEKTVIVADIDLRERLHAGYDLDVTGHYSRPDIFSFAWKL